MKYLTIITAFLFQTAFAQTGNMKNSDFKVSIPADFKIPAAPDINISNWFSLSLNLVKKQDEFFLQGEQSLGDIINYDRKKFVELVYVAIPGEQAPVVRLLPAKIHAPAHSPDAAFCFRYVFERGIFRLTVKNTDPCSFSLDMNNIFGDYRYRYILIPKSDYEGSLIDWSNYEAVAFLLNL